MLVCFRQSQQVDLHAFPQQAPTTPALVILPDLHGNVLYFLHSLFRYRLVAWKEGLFGEQQWSEVVAMYVQLDEASPETSGQALRWFVDLVEKKLCVAGATELILIGDVLADRGAHDWPTMLLLAKLIKSDQVDLHYIYGNHDDHWCSQQWQKNGEIKGDSCWRLLRNKANYFAHSHQRLGESIAADQVAHEEYQAAYKLIRSSMTPLRLVRFSKRLMICTHAPLNQIDVECMLREVEQSNSLQKSRLNWVEQQSEAYLNLINKRIQLKFQDLLKQVYDTQAHFRSLNGKKMYWIQGRIWLRPGEALDTDAWRDLGNQAYYESNERSLSRFCVHGHIGPGRVRDVYPGYDENGIRYVNLDSMLGKHAAFHHGEARTVVGLYSLSPGLFQGCERLAVSNKKLFPEHENYFGVGALMLGVIAWVGGLFCSRLASPHQYSQLTQRCIEVSAFTVFGLLLSLAYCGKRKKDQAPSPTTIPPDAVRPMAT